jgi:hypothetical protein
MLESEHFHDCEYFEGHYSYEYVEQVELDESVDPEDGRPELRDVCAAYEVLVLPISAVFFHRYVEILIEEWHNDALHGCARK